jgi:Uma2 family endonuclease
MTAEEFATLPERDDVNDELVAGSVYETPIPGLEHGVCLGEVGARLLEHVKPRGLGRCSFGSGLVVARNPDTVLAPDFQFFSTDRPPNVLRGWPTVPPRLVIEVVHGVSEYNHAILKLPYYLGFGIDVIWIIGLRRRGVEVHRLSEQPQPFDPWEWRYKGFQRATWIGETEALSEENILPGFSCRVSDLFA